MRGTLPDDYASGKIQFSTTVGHLGWGQEKIVQGQLCGAPDLIICNSHFRTRTSDSACTTVHSVAIVTTNTTQTFQPMQLRWLLLCKGNSLAATLPKLNTVDRATLSTRQ